MTKLLSLLCLASFALVTIGCGDSGPPLGKVTGKVMLYGKPYANALVTFEPDGGGPVATSTTDENGDYELWSAGKRGAQVGKHRVSIVTIQESKVETPVAPTSSDDPAYASQVFGGPAEYKKATEQKEKIPAKYNKNSELTQEVTSGSNKFDFDLK